ncbi:MAG: hypothetical protein DMF06_08875 [Verrucomicrobia bacterium]|nr:MAG: hypothetical protein DMF06_08875 [Verrucomicrobiota bacterium]
MNPLCFFAHVALAIDTDSLSRPQATANLLIELDDRTLKAGGDERQLKFSTLTDVQKVDLAGEICRTAALDYLSFEDEFKKLPARRFVDFSLTERPAYLSIRSAPTCTLPNHSKIWRLVQSESDKLRAQPLTLAT